MNCFHLHVLQAYAGVLYSLREYAKVFYNLHEYVQVSPTYFVENTLNIKQTLAKTKNFPAHGVESAMLMLWCQQ